MANEKQSRELVSPAYCEGFLHPEAILGIELFNQQSFFQAHEALETAWKAEKGPIRDLYRGILQIAVGYYHLKRGNILGARKMFKRCRVWLDKFPDRCCGIDISQIKKDYQSEEDRLNDYAKASAEFLMHLHFRPIDLSQIKRG